MSWLIANEKILVFDDNTLAQLEGKVEWQNYDGWEKVYDKKGE